MVKQLGKKSPPKLFPCWKTLVKNFTSRSDTCICYLLDICTWIYYRYRQPQYVPKLEWSKVWFATYSLSLCCCPSSTIVPPSIVKCVFVWTINDMVTLPKGIHVLLSPTSFHISKLLLHWCSLSLLQARSFFLWLKVEKNDPLSPSLAKPPPNEHFCISLPLYFCRQHHLLPGLLHEASSQVFPLLVLLLYDLTPTLWTTGPIMSLLRKSLQWLLIAFGWRPWFTGPIVARPLAASFGIPCYSVPSRHSGPQVLGSTMPTLSGRCIDTSGWAHSFSSPGLLL